MSDEERTPKSTNPLWAELRRCPSIRTSVCSGDMPRSEIVWREAPLPLDRIARPGTPASASASSDPGLFSMREFGMTFTLDGTQSRSAFIFVAVTTISSIVEGRWSVSGGRESGGSAEANVLQARIPAARSTVRWCMIVLSFIEKPRHSLGYRGSRTKIAPLRPDLPTKVQSFLGPAGLLAHGVEARGAFPFRRSAEQ